MKLTTIEFLLLVILATVALASSLLVLEGIQSSSTSGGAVAGWFSNHSSIYYQSLIPISIASWIGFAVLFTFWKVSYDRSAWRKAGFDKNVYDLMVKMRGGNSRLELLRNLESPKQRNELSHLTGIDWKEVDRQVNLLQTYGLVSVYANSGSVKIYKLTEHGHLFLKLTSELNR